jgi:hypothetical protein
MLVPAGTVVIFFCGTGAGHGRDAEIPPNPAINNDDNASIDKVL